MLDVMAGAAEPTRSRDELILQMAAGGRFETSAAALAMATLLGEAELRRQVRREIAEHGQVLPRWLAELHHAEPFQRAVEVSTVFRDVDQLLVNVTAPGGFPLTAVVLVDNELGAFAADAVVADVPLDEAVHITLEDAGEDAAARDISPADARARIEDAIRELDLGPGTGGYESWAQSRPLVEWIVSLLPAGGTVEGLPGLSVEELEAIVERFLASPFGPTWSGESLRPLVEEIVTAGSGNGIGDPLVWSPANVRKLLTEPYAVDDTTPSLHRTPELLRDLIRYGHAERGLRPELTAGALAAVDASAELFREFVEDRDFDDD